MLVEGDADRIMHRLRRGPRRRGPRGFEDEMAAAGAAAAGEMPPGLEQVPGGMVALFSAPYVFGDPLAEIVGGRRRQRRDRRRLRRPAVDVRARPGPAELPRGRRAARRARARGARRARADRRSHGRLRGHDAVRGARGACRPADRAGGRRRLGRRCRGLLPRRIDDLRAGPPDRRRPHRHRRDRRRARGVGGGGARRRARPSTTSAPARRAATCGSRRASTRAPTSCRRRPGTR